MEDLTAGQILAFTTAGLGGLAFLLNSIKQILEAWKIMRSPEKQQNDRLEALEKWKDSVERRLDRDYKQLEEQSKSSRLSQEALLVLIDHNLDGNNVEQMQAVKGKLRDYLINH